MMILLLHPFIWFTIMHLLGVLLIYCFSLTLQLRTKMVRTMQTARKRTGGSGVAARRQLEQVVKMELSGLCSKEQ